MAAEVGATAALSVATQSKFEATDRIRTRALSRDQVLDDVQDITPREVTKAPSAVLDARVPNVDLATVLAAEVNSGVSPEGLVDVANDDAAAFAAEQPAAPLPPVSDPIVVEPSSAAADDFPPTTPLNTAEVDTAPAPTITSAPAKPAPAVFAAATEAYSASIFTASTSKSASISA